MKKFAFTEFCVLGPKMGGSVFRFKGKELADVQVVPKGQAWKTPVRSAAEGTGYSSGVCEAMRVPWYEKK